MSAVIRNQQMRAAAFAYENACDCCDGEHVSRANPDQEETAPRSRYDGDAFAPAAWDWESEPARRTQRIRDCAMGFDGRDGI